MPKLEVLIGFIASGKTTYARKRADEGAMVISHDDLTEMLHQRYRYEPGLRDVYRAMETAIALNALAAGRDVIVDRTHLTLESRERWLSYAEHAPLGIDVTTVAVFFTPAERPEIHAERRFRSDPRGRPLDEWLKVATHHYEQACQTPFLVNSEPFDEVKNIDWDERSAGPSADATPPAPGRDPAGALLSLDCIEYNLRADPKDWERFRPLFDGLRAQLAYPAYDARIAQVDHQPYQGVKRD